MQADPSTEKHTQQEEHLLLHNLHRIFNMLRQVGVEFCVLRNRDRIPHGLLEGSDVDLAIPSNHSRDAVRQFLAEAQPTLVVEHHEFLQIYIQCSSYFLKIDIWWNDQQFLGAVYIRNQEIIDQSSDQEGIPTASQVHQALVSWFNSLLWAGWTKERYLPLIQEVMTHESDTFRSYLTDAVGRQLADALWISAKSGDLSRFASECRRSLWIRSLRKRPIQTALGPLWHYYRETLLWLRTPGLQIALLGPDGAGKSSVAAELSNLPHSRLPTEVKVQHIYHPLLPSPRRIRDRFLRSPLGPSRENGIVADPHGSPPRSATASVIKAFYYLVNSWLSEIVVNRYWRSRNRSVISDRNLMELPIDPLRYRYGGPRALARFVSRAAPRPDVVIVLDAPVEVLLSRKQELTPEECKRQRDAYRSLGKQLPNGYIVDASRPLPEVVEEVREIIIRCMAQRTARRLSLEKSL